MVDPLPSPEQQHLAAELALGLLEGAERAEALRLCLSDPAFAAEVEAWSHRLSPLLDLGSAEPPSPRVWQAIDARTAGTDDEYGTIRRLRLWRGGAIVAGAVAACLAIVLLTRPNVPGLPETLGVAQLAGAQGTTMAVSYDPKSGLLRLSASPLERSAKSPELWVIPEDGVPRSLGIIAGQGGTLAVGAEVRQYLRSGVTLAITLEDPATAPHKAPSSAPVLTGKISII